MEHEIENVKLKIELSKTQIELFTEKRKRYFYFFSIIDKYIKYNQDMIAFTDANLSPIRYNKTEVSLYKMYTKLFDEETDFLADDTTKSYELEKHYIEGDSRRNYFKGWCNDANRAMNNYKNIIKKKFKDYEVEIEILKRNIHSLEKEIISIVDSNNELLKNNKERTNRNSGITKRIRFWAEKIIQNKHAKLDEIVVLRICTELKNENFEPNKKSVHTALNKMGYGNTRV